MKRKTIFVLELVQTGLKVQILHYLEKMKLFANEEVKINGKK